MADYSVDHPDGYASAWGPTPESLGRVLRGAAAWPPGIYPIAEYTGTSQHRHARRWGVAFKHPDGSVELVPGDRA